MTSSVDCHQIILEFAKNEPVSSDVLEEIAECCADALDRDARFVAFGPVVSCDFNRSAIEVEFTVAADTPEQADERVARVGEIMQGAIFRCEYRMSAERTAVPA